MVPDGSMASHAEPAWTLLATTPAVDNEPQTCVPSYQVLKMRESLLSSGPSLSFCDGPKPGRQVTVMQSRNGTLPAFCSDAGGTTYTSEGTVVRDRSSARGPPTSDRVFD